LNNVQITPTQVLYKAAELLKYTQQIPTSYPFNPFIIIQLPHNFTSGNNTNDMTAKDDRAGLTWPEGFSDEIRTKWATEPDILTITAIVQQALHIGDRGELSVEFLELSVELLAKGTFSKLYAIDCARNVGYIMRITLPVVPLRKNLSELATIKYVRQNTDIPVPRVVARSKRSRNTLGFEWTIMERIPGDKLCEQWRRMSWEKKEELVRKVVKYQVQLFNNRFPQIGSLYLTETLRTLISVLPPSAARPNFKVSAFPYCLGQIVSVPFFYHKNRKFNRCRGPYTYTWDWLAARLRTAAADVDNQSVCSNGKEEALCGDSGDDTLEHFMNPDEAHIPCCDNWEADPHALLTAASTNPRIQRLINLLPKIFPSGETEECMLFHHDLSGNNILVDQNHEISGIIDWEGVHTVPLWLGCQIPKFLHSREVNELPPFRTGFEDEEDKNQYWRLVEDYGKTQLRAFFLEEMQQVCPEWMKFHQAGSLKADFSFAVDTVALPVPVGATDHFERWLEQVEQGAEHLNLRSTMDQS
jgi:aminoglycoside phosphotransferase (APT) family kinase protein